MLVRIVRFRRGTNQLSQNMILDSRHFLNLRERLVITAKLEDFFQNTNIFYVYIKKWKFIINQEEMLLRVTSVIKDAVIHRKKYDLIYPSLLKEPSSAI